MLDDNSIKILDFIKENPGLSSKEIHGKAASEISYATLKRILTKFISENYLQQQGKGKGTKYIISPAYGLLFPVDLENYFKKETDARKIKNSFSFSLVPEVLSNAELFTKVELQHLTNLQNKHKENYSKLTITQYHKELDRLAIDLSWKSSQIEGNTYSLLETERLLKEKITADGKEKDEAVMLLNHKEALDFIIKHPTYTTPLSIAKIESIHSLLMKELGVEKNIRNRRVGISGTNYKPLDNEFQIQEALFEMCKLVNHKESIFEKALLLLVLISYIQPFEDGNKRTARIISNAVLIANKHCPISFRTVDSIEYKKTMLLFYEQNNISAFKTIFINQFEFAVGAYF